ncbi:hypothetical protein ABJY94_18500 [Vibrio parahaemolyticus]|uniref:hypothetical protein n=1 Tax=Vibrio parahaemolyticus TaxID=670 RepID=UPI0032AF31B7
MTLSIATIKSAAAGCESAIDLLNEHYCYGHCMDLAIALHRAYGYTIQASMVESKWVGHAWVRLPDGTYLDILSRYTDTDELESFGDGECTLSFTNEGDFVSMLEIKDNELEVFSNDLAIAQEVVGIYLAPKFNLSL